MKNGPTTCASDTACAPRRPRPPAGRGQLPRHPRAERAERLRHRAQRSEVRAGADDHGGALAPQPRDRRLEVAHRLGTGTRWVTSLPPTTITATSLGTSPAARPAARAAPRTPSPPGPPWSAGPTGGRAWPPPWRAGHPGCPSAVPRRDRRRSSRRASSRSSGSPYLDFHTRSASGRLAQRLADQPAAAACRGAARGRRTEARQAAATAAPIVTRPATHDQVQPRRAEWPATRSWRCDVDFGLPRPSSR